MANSMKATAEAIVKEINSTERAKLRGKENSILNGNNIELKRIEDLENLLRQIERHTDFRVRAKIADECKLLVTALYNDNKSNFTTEVFTGINNNLTILKIKDVEIVEEAQTCGLLKADGGGTERIERGYDRAIDGIEQVSGAQNSKGYIYSELYAGIIGRVAPSEGNADILHARSDKQKNSMIYDLINEGKNVCETTRGITEWIDMPGATSAVNCMIDEKAIGEAIKDITPNEIFDSITEVDLEGQKHPVSANELAFKDFKNDEPAKDNASRFL